VRPRSRPRPEKARPRSRPRPKKCYETETNNYDTETSVVNSVAYESKTNRYASIIDYNIFEMINDE